MPIVVAPAPLHQPGAIVTEDVYGDASAGIAGTALGQRFVFDASGVAVFGDAETIGGTGRGGADRLEITRVGAGVIVAGDARQLTDSAQGGNDAITGGGDGILLFGDAYSMLDASVGGNDTIRILGLSNLGLAAGDAGEMSGDARGGDDVLYGRYLIGDAGDLWDRARGGDDRLFGRGAGSVLVGDGELRGETEGGNDRLIANHRDSLLHGDAQRMEEHARGGDDYLHSKQGGCTLYGDAETMADDASGGNDVLSGSAEGETIIGDAARLSDRSICGDDVLLGGKGDDTLYGDGLEIGAEVTRGADRFVFAKDCGRDVIGDFERDVDLIDLQRFGYTSFGQLTIHEVGGDSVIDLPGTNQVTVTGVLGLAAADFLLT